MEISWNKRNQFHDAYTHYTAIKVLYVPLERKFPPSLTHEVIHHLRTCIWKTESDRTYFADEAQFIGYIKHMLSLTFSLVSRIHCMDPLSLDEIGVGVFKLGI